MSYMAPNFCRYAYNDDHSSNQAPLNGVGVTGEAGYFGSDVTNYSIINSVCQETIANFSLGNQVSFGVAFDEATCQIYLLVVEEEGQLGYMDNYNQNVRVDDNYAVKGFYLDGHD